VEGDGATGKNSEKQRNRGKTKKNPNEEI